MSSLGHLKGRGLFAARPGGAGEGGLRHGPSAEPVRVLVPVGTVARRAAGGELIGELMGDGDDLLVARGGKGGVAIPALRTAATRPPGSPSWAAPATSLRWSSSSS